MLKKICTILVISMLFTTNAYAADNAFKSFGNEVKEANKAVLNKKVDSAAADKKAKIAENKAKISQLKDQQKQEQNKYKKAIKDKKAELAEVKKNKSNMSQQQKAAKEAAIQKQIDELYKKDAAMKDNYNKKIEALKI